MKLLPIDTRNKTILEWLKKNQKISEFVKSANPKMLEKFKVEKNSRQHHFWLRNALPIWTYNRKVLEQKLNYIHLNPLQSHWNLVNDPNDYLYSSCSFYERNDQRYPWLTHYMEVI